MQVDHDKEFVLSLLRKSELQVQPITEPSTPNPPKTPDLRVMTPEGNILSIWT
jgi:hypothetical protein